MKKLLVVLLILIPTINLYPQAKNDQQLYLSDAYSLFEMKRYDAAESISKDFIKNNKDSVDEAYLLLGKIYSFKGKFRDALNNLQLSIVYNSSDLDLKGISLNEIANCYYSLGNYDSSKFYLNLVLNMDVNDKIINTSKNNLQLFGFANFYNSWIKINSNHFNIFVQAVQNNNEVINLSQNLESIFDSINKVFNITLDKKIDLFIWNIKTKNKITFEKSLPFSISRYSIIHIEEGNSLGYQISSLLVSLYNKVYSPRVTKLDTFINRSIAAYFDFKSKNHFSECCNILNNKNIKININEIWDSGLNNELKLLEYHLGAFLIENIILDHGIDKIPPLTSNSSYKKASLLYGNNLNNTIIKVQNKIDSCLK